MLAAASRDGLAFLSTEYSSILAPHVRLDLEAMNLDLGEKESVEMGSDGTSSSACAVARGSAMDDPGASPVRSAGTWREALDRLCSTRINGTLGLVGDVGISAFLLWTAFRSPELRTLPALYIVLAGALVFSFVEYCFHRWMFHGSTALFEQGHHRHHEEPAGYDSLPFFLVPLGIFAAAESLALAIPREIALLFAGGFAGGYAAYGVSHTVIHHMRFRNAFMRRWAASHHIHHRHPGSNFGVTTPLWDFV
ncbi:MAG TPA: sterol desaturase family protein, partial [Rhodanobacteraceae bacterium]|nr:sterol desaturase family protein [Rhodanobacteraceae bacterium]